MTIWFTCLALLFQLCLSHMEMSQPPAIKSKFNPNYDYKGIDYSYTEPLAAGGYPCKGYHTSEPRWSVANYTVGETQKLTLAGSATHKGGSCQVALSYDAGKSFQVIKSMIGGCPLKKEYDFVVPSSAPAGQALLSWSWMNNEGNREFYMNCAWVNIANGNGAAKSESTVNAFSAQPQIFKAQMKGECTVPEGFDYVYPEPGSEVEYGGNKDKYTTTCKGGAAAKSLSSNNQWANQTRSNGLHSLLKSQDGETPEQAESAPTESESVEDESAESDDASDASDDESPKTVYETITEKETKTIYAQPSSTVAGNVETSALYPPTLPRSLLGNVDTDTNTKPTGRPERAFTPDYPVDFAESYPNREVNRNYQPSYDQYWDNDEASYDDNSAYDNEEADGQYNDTPEWYGDDNSYDDQESERVPQESNNYYSGNGRDTYYRGNMRNVDYRYPSRNAEVRQRRYRAYDSYYPQRGYPYNRRAAGSRYDRGYQAGYKNYQRGEQQLQDRRIQG